MPFGYFVYRNSLYQVFFRVKSVKDMNNNKNKTDKNNNKKTIKIDKALMLRIRG